MTLTADQVDWVAHLARLQLTPKERDVIAGQLNAILEYMTQLQKLDTTHVEPLAHPLPIQNVFRGDTPEASLSADEALSNAPARRDDFYAVPAVLE